MHSACAVGEKDNVPWILNYLRRESRHICWILLNYVMPCKSIASLAIYRFECVKRRKTAAKLDSRIRANDGSAPPAASYANRRGSIWR